MVHAASALFHKGKAGRIMGKIALLVSREEMLYKAHNLLQEKKYAIHEMRVIRTEDAVMEARQSIAGGASIIIARGLQASLIKQYTDIPVAEIVLTAQEMGLLIMRAKQIIPKSIPVIAVVGFENMFCDMSYFEELYGIELRMYYAKQGDELKDAARQAVEDQADLLIGGDTAVEEAKQAGVASLFLSITEDSIKNAFAMAESMDYAMSVEKKTAAQMETLLDYSFSGVLRLDGNGIITGANPLIEDMTGKSQQELKGKHIREVAPQVGRHELDQVLQEGRDCSLLLEWNHTPVLAVLAPVLFENRVDGVIVTCHKMNKKGMPAGGQTRQGQGMPPLVRFEDLLQCSRAMQECIRLAKSYALSGHPVVIMGEPGTEKRMIAESIHNLSSRRAGPFLDVPCEGLSGDEQNASMFGDQGAVRQAEGGSLLIQEVECLTGANQYRLYQLIRFRVRHGVDAARLKKADVRVMVTVRKPLNQLLAQGEIRQDLYYLLSGLELVIPPLRERREDLCQTLDQRIRDCCGFYSRYHALTKGAKNLMMEYPWKGNLLQVESFCERLILTAEQRSIDEIAVRKLLNELYDSQDGVSQVYSGGPLASEQASWIAEALHKHKGNRDKTAKELGISKTTLWRRMKQFGIYE